MVNGLVPIFIFVYDCGIMFCTEDSLNGGDWHVGIRKTKNTCPTLVFEVEDLTSGRGGDMDIEMA